MIRDAVPTLEVEISRPQAINFTMQAARTLLFDFANIVIDSHVHYDGEYVITPRVYSQTLETDDKVCDDDITVLSIPIAQVSNPQGGKTATIG